MNRRGFLKALGTAIAGVAVSQVIPDDPERRIWVPGEKTHFLPPAGGWVAPNGADYWYLRLRRVAGLDDALRFRWPGTEDAIDQAAKDLAAKIDQEILALYNVQNPSILVKPGGEVQTLHSDEFYARVKEMLELKEQVLAPVSERRADAIRFIRDFQVQLERNPMRLDLLYGRLVVQNPPYMARILEDDAIPKDEIRVAAGLRPEQVGIIQNIAE